jgi:hypothetical protein
VDEVVAPIAFVVVRGHLSVDLPGPGPAGAGAGEAAGPSAAPGPALTLARIPVTAKIVLDPAVLGGGGGGAVLDAWGPVAHDVAFGDHGARLTQGFIGVRLLEVVPGGGGAGGGGGGGGLRVEGQLSGVLAGAGGTGVAGGATFLQVGFRLAHGGGGADDDGAVAVRHVRRVPFTHEEGLAGGAARVTLLGPAAAPADECKAHGQLVRGTLTVLVGTSSQ